uniref:Class I SAM-dependent methyltransferase n=1 Tax=Haemonchus placei TaxID=6290 RepID=A0A0N4X4Q4_HAEPC
LRHLWEKHGCIRMTSIGSLNDWLAEGQSPNWTVASESKWETYILADI